jgi:hypothetical protein
VLAEWAEAHATKKNEELSGQPERADRDAVRTVKRATRRPSRCAVLGKDPPGRPARGQRRL